MKRIHRSIVQRMAYLAVYECRQCHDQTTVPRRVFLHFGPSSRCPRCGTFRLNKLRTPDRIDPMRSGLLNWLERLAGGSRYHCSFCRIQFFDRRPLAPDAHRPAATPDAQQRVGPSRGARSAANPAKAG